MKKSTLISSITLIVISIISLTSATYAWFTMNKDASTDSLLFEVSGPPTVEISLDGETWSNQVILPATSLSMRPTSSATSLNGSFYWSTTNVSKISVNTEGAFIAIPDTAGKPYQYYYDTTLYFRTKGTYSLNLTLGDLSLGNTDLNKAIRIAFLSPDGTAYSSGSTPLIYALMNTPYNAAASVDTISPITPHTAGDNTVIANIPVDATDIDVYGAITSIKVRIYLEGQDDNCVIVNALNSLSVAMNFYCDEVKS